MPVAALGGTFLSSQDPVRLQAWFKERLGLAMASQGDGAMAILPSGEHIAVLGVQKAHDGAPGLPDAPVMAEPYGRQAMMLNLRVEDLDGMIAHLKGLGDDVVGPADFDEVGRFAWVRTPDGHDVELWESVPQPAVP